MEERLDSFRCDYLYMSGRATNGLVKPPQTHLTPWWLSWMLCLSTVHEQTVKDIRLKVFSSPPPADMGLGMPVEWEAQLYCYTGWPAKLEERRANAQPAWRACAAVAAAH